MRSNRTGTGLLFPELSIEPEDLWVTASMPRHRFIEDSSGLTALELCAGAGGQAIGFEQAGFKHVGLVEINKYACATLRLNRPSWNVIEDDLNWFSGSRFKGVDVVSGGLPCPPFSVAGKQLGEHDDRNLFPALIRLVDEIRPRAVMIENVGGLLNAAFKVYRGRIRQELVKLGYAVGFKLMNACEFGVPQLRPRVILLAVQRKLMEHFFWPEPSATAAETVGVALYDLMASDGWKDARAWALRADKIAPTIVGGSYKHGGPDLGPTRARKAWNVLGVDGLGVANEPPSSDFAGTPRLTVRMVARLQGFPDSWSFTGSKTHAYRQVANAFPPPFARVIAARLSACLLAPRYFEWREDKAV